jgi:3-phenylpropionate/cinnamic acid dioxygenase small subunit
VDAAQTRWVPASPALQGFISYEALLLNDAAFEDWLALYTSDASYWMPADWCQEDAQDHVSLINDSRAMMEVRIRRLRHPKLYSQQPFTRAVRLIANVFTADLRGDAGERLVVRSNFLCLLHRLHHTHTLGGTYEHHIRIEGEQMFIARKVVRLINCDVPLSNVGVPL